jgi:hypothetical protein
MEATMNREQRRAAEKTGNVVPMQNQQKQQPGIFPDSNLNFVSVPDSTQGIKTFSKSFDAEMKNILESSDWNARIYRLERANI